MESAFKVTIKQIEDNKYQATYQMGKLGGSESFDTFEEAAAFIEKLEKDYDQSRQNQK